MTRISCEVARDLLPLYCDDVCSQESRILIEEHLKNCSDCDALLKKMKMARSRPFMQLMIRKANPEVAPRKVCEK